jgi:hypothetical protein
MHGGGLTWGAEVPPPRCLLEQGRENIGMERGNGRVVIFFLSKTDGLPTEIKRRGKRLIHFTNIGAMMQSCKRRGKNDVSAHNRGKYAIIPKIYNAIYATHTASEESSSENQESGPFVAFHSRLLYARESVQIERKIMPN